MGKIYTALFSLALPAVLLRLYWRGIKAPQYRSRWRERLGQYSCPPQKNTLWFHAVSVGEAEAAFVLIKLLQKRYPQAAFLVTTTTPTGSARVQAVLGDTVTHVYLPYDLPWIVERFLLHFQPKIAVILEKELWPNLFAACGARGIPLFIVNARLSSRSVKSYQKVSGLVKSALTNVRLIATQTDDDRQNFMRIGAVAQQVQVLGNIKFDMAIDSALIQQGQALKNQLFAKRFVWIIGSSHQGEEIVFLKAYQAIKPLIPELLLLIVPRHPERFQEVKKLCQDFRFTVAMRSEVDVIAANCDVYIADSVGELKMLYAAADLAFVAGSLMPVGGHNVLEPAAVGTPVLFGSHMFNFQEIALQMLNAQAAVQCSEQDEIVAAVTRLYHQGEQRKRMIDNAGSFVRLNQGATDRVANFMATYL